MDSDVAPERGFSSSMSLYCDEGKSEEGRGGTFAPGRLRAVGVPRPESDR